MTIGIFDYIILWFITGGAGASMQWLFDDAEDEQFPSYMMRYAWRGPIVFFYNFFRLFGIIYRGLRGKDIL